jgi:hypothetical protein
MIIGAFTVFAAVTAILGVWVWQRHALQRMISSAANQDGAAPDPAPNRTP